MKLFMRSIIFVCISYFIVKCIEKYFWEHTSPELKKELKKKSKNLS